MRACAFCGAAAESRVVAPVGGGVRRAGLCRPCLEEIAGQARRGGRSACLGCRSVAVAVERARALAGGGVEVTLPERVRHVRRCRRFPSLLLSDGRPSPSPSPSPSASAWAERRAWLLKAGAFRERQRGAGSIPPLLLAYRDRWLVARVVALAPGAGEIVEAVPPAAVLAACLGATQIRLVVDAWVRTDLEGRLPSESLSDDPRARSALLAHDWDVTTGTEQLEVLYYTIGDDGTPVVDRTPRPLNAGGVISGNIHDMLRLAVDHPHAVPALRFATRLAASGYEVEVYPFPAERARTVEDELHAPGPDDRLADPPDLPEPGL